MATRNDASPAGDWLDGLWAALRSLPMQDWLPVLQDAFGLASTVRQDQAILPLNRHPPARPCISVIVVSHNEGAYLRRTVHSLLQSLPAAGEVIVVDDGSNDGSARGLSDPQGRLRTFHHVQSLGVSRARNWGASAAQGDILVFSDAHVEVECDWVPLFCSLLARSTTEAVGPAILDYHFRRDHSKGYGLRFRNDSVDQVWLDQQYSFPYPVPLLGGFFFAMRRGVFKSVGGFDEGMIRYGVEDMEMCIRLYALGYDCLLVPTVEVAHLSTRLTPLPDYQKNWVVVLHNVLRLGVIHYGEERLRRLLSHHASDSVFPAALARVISSDAPTRWLALMSQRRYTDAEYFRRFNMP